MELLPLIGAFAAVLSPIAAIVASVLTVRAMRKRDIAAAETEGRQVDVSEKDSHTKELEMIFSAYGASQESMAKALERVEKEQEKLSKQYSELDEKHTKLEEEHQEFKDQHYREREEMIGHIIALEHLVPNPPGPPTRPQWMTAA